MKLIDSVINVVFTPKCIACGSLTENVYLCKKCLDNIHLLCVDSFAPVQKYYETLWALAAYEGPWMEVVHHFKYGRERVANRVIFDILRQKISKFDHIDCIVPVPQHNRRYIRRGYNQSAIIAKMISKIIGRPTLLRAIMKTVNTSQQVGKTLNERKINLRNAFCLPKFLPQSVRQKNILLVDDVVTSGSTVDECARILRKAGARRVDVLTLAKTL